jgi:hypothetical protein
MKTSSAVEHSLKIKMKHADEERAVGPEAGSQRLRRDH